MSKASYFLRQHGSTVAIVTGIVLVGTYLWVTKNSQPTGEKVLRKQNLLKIFRSEQLTKIDVKHGAEGYTLSRKSTNADAGDGSLWRIRSGSEEAMADQLAVEKLLSALEFASPERKIPENEVDRVKFGLEKPRFSITLTMGSLNTTLKVGGLSVQPKDASYVDVDGDVSVLGKNTVTELDLAASAYRTKRLIPYISTLLSQIELRGKEGKIVFQRGEAENWFFSKDIEGGGRVDRFQFDKLLIAFADLKSESFPQESEAKQIQSKADRKIELLMIPKDSSRKVGKLIIGGECPHTKQQVIVVRESPTPLVACAPEAVVAPFFATSKSYLDERVFSFRADEVEEITIEAGAERLEIARKGADWHQRSPTSREVTAELAMQLVKDLVSTKSKQSEIVSDPLPKELTPPQSKVTVRGIGRGSNPSINETIEVGKVNKEGLVPIHRLLDHRILYIPKEAARAFLPRSSALRKLELITFPTKQVRRVVVRSEQIDQVIERGANDVWKFVKPAKFPLDIGVAGDIAETLVHLKAEKWVADKDDGSFGLKKPRLTFEVTVQADDAGATSYKGKIGDSTASGLYGSLDGQEGVFVLPSSVERNLNQWALDRTVSVIDSSEVDLITLKHDKKTIVLKADHEQYKVAEGGPEISSARLDAARQAMNELRAEATVHIGPAKSSEGFEKPNLVIEVKRKPGKGERSKDVRLVVGSGDSFQGTSIFYLQCDGIDAVYAVAASRIRTLLGLFLAQT
jgi:hypothetical protein